MGLGWRTIILLLIVVLVGSSCNRFVKYGSGYKHGGQPRSHRGEHVVTRGDTLYSIAWQYGYDHRQVAYWNNIREPYTIYPGQKLQLVPTKKTKQKAGARTPSNSKTPQVAPRKRSTWDSRKSASKSDKKRKIAKPITKKLTWQWPTKGRIIGVYSKKDPGKKGVDISGRMGQKIYAAAGGKVVYSGSGLRGYGELIIIKHNNTYFSAYAHNRKLQVKEKQKVKKGQHIADMGNSGTDKVMLHFEIRRNGIPTNPLRYLPKR